jgi:serine/threonine-protein kinase
MPNLAGEAGRYHLIGEIARGGMGVIFKGRDVDLGRDLVVKVILERHQNDPEIVRRFVEEAQIGGQLQHPGIVPVHEIGRFADGRLYIAMKLVKGRTLAALLEARKDTRSERSRFVSIFEQMCQTIAYAHSRGVVHRDLKPSNVMVGNFGEVQVMDWGLAKVLEQGGVADEATSRRKQGEVSEIRTLRSGSGAGDSRAGSVLGTPAYMAPEQARGAGDTVDERADVFGLGSILSEVLTGLPAYTGASHAELYRKAERALLSDAYARLDASGADLELVALAKSCLSAAAKDRPRDAGVVSDAVSAYLAGADSRLRAAGIARAQAETRAAEERKRRILTLALAGSILASVIVVGGAWVWMIHDRMARDAKAARTQAAREAQVANDVNKSLEEAALLRGQARSGRADPLRWGDAMAAARRAQAILAQGQGSPELEKRVQSLMATIARERDEARETMNDGRMVERLAAIHDDIAVHLDRTKADQEYVAAFRNYGIDIDALAPAAAAARIAVRPIATELAVALDRWAFNRRMMYPRDLAGARRLVDLARAADPDPWRNRLRDALELSNSDMKLGREALERLAASADASSLPVASVERLATDLFNQGSDTIALSLFRRAQRAHPGDFWINFNLALAEMRSGGPEDAIRFFSVAVAIRPRSSLALYALAEAQQGGGHLGDAAETFRTDLRFYPADTRARVGLGTVLVDQGDRQSADAEFRKAKSQNPNDWMIRSVIGSALVDRGEWDLAIAEFREAVQCAPKTQFAHHRLAAGLFEEGRIGDALTSCGEAIRLDPGFGPGFATQGHILMAMGDFEAAAASFRQYRPGPAHTRERLSAEALTGQATRMIALDARLPALLRGEDRPSGASESVEFARLCGFRQHFARSARLWADAFSAQPETADDIRVENRYAAACSAALAGSGKGRDNPAPDEPARARLRSQALGWLEAELAWYSKQAGAGQPRDRARTPRVIGRWQVDPALAGIRDEAVLAALPESEAKRCRALWAGVETLRQRIVRAGMITGLAHPF